MGYAPDGGQVKTFLTCFRFSLSQSHFVLFPSILPPPPTGFNSAFFILQLIISPSSQYLHVLLTSCPCPEDSLPIYLAPHIAPPPIFPFLFRENVLCITYVFSTMIFTIISPLCIWINCTHSLTAPGPLHY